MADYVVSFIGHIAPSLRPHGFPSFVRDDVVCRVDSLDALRKITDTRYFSYIRKGGMFVYINPAKIDDSKFIPDSQMFVPMHMISYISTVTEKLSSEVPDTGTALLN